MGRASGVGTHRLHLLFRDPALVGAALGRRLSSRFHWRRPITLLTVGFIVGFLWAFLFNGILGARLGVFYYGHVIPGLALWQGTKHQYPLYDAVAMGVMMMVFAYILGRTDPEGRTVIEAWAAAKSPSASRSTVLSVVGVVVIANLVYGAVFAPHLVTKLEGQVTAGPTAPFFQACRTNRCKAPRTAAPDPIDRRTAYDPDNPHCRVRYDPYDIDIDDDPYPTWRRLRDEVSLVPQRGLDFYALSRWDDVKPALLDWDRYRSGPRHHPGDHQRRDRDPTGHPPLRGPAHPRPAQSPARPRVHTETHVATSSPSSAASA